MLHPSLLRHRRRLRCYSCFSTVPLSHPVYTIWSANTSLGKTLVSTGLAFSFLLSPPSNPRKFVYLKPLQTGFPSDSDSRSLFHKLSLLSSLRASPLVSSHSVLHSSLAAAKSFGPGEYAGVESTHMCDLGFREVNRSPGNEVLKGGSPELVCETFYAWEGALSPHLAVEREGGMVEDSTVVGMVENRLREELVGIDMEAFCVVETAGGVASPGPSGTLQCDLYRPLRLPGVLVGDGRLGGISGTISAYESLKLRGYDVVAIAFEDHGLRNEVPLMSYLRNRVPVLVLPSLPAEPSDDLMKWFDESKNVFDVLKEIMVHAYSERIKRLSEMPKMAGDIFWWPFTQHKLVPTGAATVIDSRCGENFAVSKVPSDKCITQQFDACASWWTQGPDASLQTELARDIGYAAARFGHVMFPENVYEPALECAEALLEGVGAGWASRVYFSDNGSTANEIALKMAFRKFLFDHNILVNPVRNDAIESFINLKYFVSGWASRVYFSDNGSTANEIALKMAFRKFLFDHNILVNPVRNDAIESFINLKVLALKGSYHGDTLGAMEAQAPSSYTGFLQQPWYTGRGLFLDPPTVFMTNGEWHLLLPEVIRSKVIPKDKTFKSCDEVFLGSRKDSVIAGVYSVYISQEISKYAGLSDITQIGALIIEPVVQGAGGMHMIDPLFQWVLVIECKHRKIPVIFDEVFTGFWRLGVETAAELLGCVPDIACFAKLMTGGIVPLAATLATEAVFNSFAGDSKLVALLHGHSYSAHAIGCTAAAKSIKSFKDPQMNSNIIYEKSQQKSLRELWDADLVEQISCHRYVQRVIAIGTLFALELRADGTDAGYNSLIASSLLHILREDGMYMRPLGNVIYLMCGPCTSPQICRQLLLKLHRALDLFNPVEQRR